MSTVTVPNTVTTGASTGADVNGRAVQVIGLLTPGRGAYHSWESKPFNRGAGSSVYSHPT
jgi:hypothetical protein